MQANGQIPDFCVVGEPTCPAQLGDMVKIGRRGSLKRIPHDPRHARACGLSAGARR